MDKWLAYFANFQRSCHVSPDLHRHLHQYYNRMDIDLVQLSARLRVRFLPTRTLDMVLKAKQDFTHTDKEKRASYVERYNDLLGQQKELDRHFTK